MFYSFILIGAFMVRTFAVGQGAYRKQGARKAAETKRRRISSSGANARPPQGRSNALKIKPLS